MWTAYASLFPACFLLYLELQVAILLPWALNFDLLVFTSKWLQMCITMPKEGVFDLKKIKIFTITTKGYSDLQIY